MRNLPLMLLLLILACPWPAQAVPAWPAVTAIVFDGNKVTRERVMLREMSLGPGDPADPRRIEESRQAILDLGLFRDVEIDQHADRDGVVLTVRVREKRYLLPIPRLDTSSDKDYSYGAQVRWSNVFGRNHRLNAFVQRGRFPQDRNREREQGARIAYTAPHVWDTSWLLRATAEHIERQTPSPEGGYDEDFQRVQLLAAYDLREGRPRRGWILGGGVFWQDQKARGEFAPASDGHATALVGTADFNDVRFHVYSESGQRFSVRLEAARRGWASDYSYARLTGRYQAFIPIGDRAHQSLHLLAEGGAYSGGPRSRNHYSLGGSTRLRAYDVDYLEGDRFWHVSSEFLRPIWRDWLRLFVVGEVGGIGRDVRGNSPRGPHASIGIGARMRFTWFVEIEIETGIAWPLRGGGGAQFFAGGEG
ncbi:MAG TPA: POTRA domain-containing protein [Xanthomonadaceae bacterium]|nr:POTRA domain-containing protein [Xanthomonadaceae bacterium]